MNLYSSPERHKAMGLEGEVVCLMVALGRPTDDLTFGFSEKKTSGYLFCPLKEVFYLECISQCKVWVTFVAHICSILTTFCD